MTPREGSTLYYSLLWTSEESRTRFLASLELIDAIATTLDEVQEASVVEHKVHWWHEELERLHSGTPRHPQTSACHELLAGNTLARAQLLDVLSVATNNRLEPASTEIESNDRLVRDHGARLALLTLSLDPSSTPRATFTSDMAMLARGLGLRDQLARLPSLLHRGHPVFSNERYAHHGIDPRALAGHVRVASPLDESTADARTGSTSGIGNIPVISDSGDRHALVAAAVDEAHQLMSDGMSDNHFREIFGTPTLGPLARLVALRNKELALWQKHRPDLLRERIELTPFRRFLLAWRYRRGAW